MQESSEKRWDIIKVEISPTRAVIKDSLPNFGRSTHLILFNYLVWHAKTNLHPLIILQKKAMRHISRVAPREHTNQLFKNLNLLKVTDILRVNLAWNGLLPNTFHDFFN